MDLESISGLHDLTLTGNHTLTVNNNSGDGIAVNNINIINGTVNAEGDGTGIAANQVNIHGGNVTAKGTEIGIYGDTGVTVLAGATVSAEGSFAGIATNNTGTLNVAGKEAVEITGSVGGYPSHRFKVAGKGAVAETKTTIPESSGSTTSGSGSTSGSSSSSGSNTSSGSTPGRSEAGHNHSYIWEQAYEATDDTDAEWIYVCSCGHIKERVKIPNSAFYRFVERSANQIAQAAPNATLTIDALKGNWNAFHTMVFTAWRNRPDVTVEILYRHKGQIYTLTVAPGADLSTLPGGAAYTGDETASGCAGFLFLAQQTGSVPIGK